MTSGRAALAAVVSSVLTAVAIVVSVWLMPQPGQIGAPSSACAVAERPSWPTGLRERLAQRQGGLDYWTGAPLPEATDIDHVLPWQWALCHGLTDPVAFYSDERNLVLTGSSVNRAKGADVPWDPEGWRPSVEGRLCDWADTWATTMGRHRLRFGSASEAMGLAAVRKRCAASV